MTEVEVIRRWQGSPVMGRVYAEDGTTLIKEGERCGLDDEFARRLADNKHPITGKADPLVRIIRMNVPATAGIASDGVLPDAARIMMLEEELASLRAAQAPRQA